MSSKNFLNLSRYLVLAVILITSLALLIPISMVKADSVVTFTDNNLEAAIREAIPKPSGDIYESDLIGPTHILTTLGAANRGIVDLTGLEHCTALTTLDLQGNLTDNLTPLSGLTSLTVLGLDSDNVSDLTPLSGLTNLTSLSMNNNHIDDISPIAGLTKLTMLWFEGNLTDNLTPLSGLTNLTTLGINYNHVEDISPIAGLTKLTTLYLHGNQTDNLTPLSGLTNLTVLGLNDNEVVSDLSPLSGLTNLQRLGLNGNQISDLTPLSGLTNLWDLRLMSNQISDISPVDNLTKLVSLFLVGNKINNLAPLSGLTTLTGLWLSGNQISNLAPLSGLTNISVLTLYNNQIRDIQPLVSNPGMGSGDTVELWNNPLNAHTVNTCIPALTGREVTVFWDGIPAGDQNPNQPTNESPLSGATEVSLTPTLQSSLFSDNDTLDTHAASQWQLTTTAGDYSIPVFDSDTDSVNLTSITVPSLSYSTTYCWRVAHRDNHGAWSPWSTETFFITINRPPNQPANASPANGATQVSPTPMLQSSAFSDPDAGNTHAASQWQVTATPGDYSSPVYDSLTDNASLVSRLVPSGELSYSTTYYWHVRHEDNRGAWSSWSGETSFTTTNHPPNQPANESPLNGATGQTLTPTLTSSGCSDSDTGDTHASSWWQVTTTPGDYSSPVFESATDNSNLASITLPLLAYSTVYYWHVRHQDNHGDWSEWSAETHFTTINHPPNRPASVSPADGATGQGVAPTLTCSVFLDSDAGDTHAASQWQVTVTPADYTSPVFDSLEDYVNLVSIQVPSGKLGYSTVYYWHVRHQDNHGDWSEWSAETHFTTINHPPNRPASVSPADGATGQGVAPTLTCSVFLDSDAGDTHAASQWQVTVTLADYTSPVFNSLEDYVNLVSIQVPSGKLGYSTVYYWHVRHQDNHGDWSDWSAETSFVTGNETTPPVISNVTEASISTTGATVTWTTDEGATSQVEYGLDTTYGSSTTLDSNLVTSHSSNLAGLKPGKTYYYRVISKDAANNEAISGGGTFTTSTRSGGTPAWLWVVIGIVALLAVGTVGFLVSRRFARE